jgi:hypothetical protein
MSYPPKHNEKITYVVISLLMLLFIVISFAMLMRKHYQKIRGSVLWCFILWIFARSYSFGCNVWRLSLGPGADDSRLDKRLWTAEAAINYLCYILFMAVIQRLRFLEIYMDIENDSAEKIMNGMRQWNNLRYAYFIFLVAFIIPTLFEQYVEWTQKPVSWQSKEDLYHRVAASNLTLSAI